MSDKKGNTGHWNTGDWNTGDHNTGNRNTGHRNTGHYNTGDHNTGDHNTGHYNTGHYNTGDHNTGNRNTGNRNTGNLNTGHWNTGNRNTGFFNTTTPATVRVFDGHEVDRDEFINACPSWLFDIPLSEWVDADDMLFSEKQANPSWQTTGGFLRQRTYKEAWRVAYEKARHDPANIDAVRALPGFDARVFFEITGLDLGIGDTVPGSCDGKIVEIDGKRYQLKEI